MSEIHTMRIIDAHAKKEWENLLGYPLKADFIRLTHSFYVKHAHIIQSIQMNSAFRYKFIQGNF